MDVAKELLKYKYKGFQKEQIAQIHRGFIAGFTESQMKLFVNRKYNWQQMYIISEGIKHGFTEEQIKLYAKPEITPAEMCHIYNYLMKRKLSRIND